MSRENPSVGSAFLLTTTSRSAMLLRREVWFNGTIQRGIPYSCAYDLWVYTQCRSIGLIQFQSGRIWPGT